MERNTSTSYRETVMKGSLSMAGWSHHGIPPVFVYVGNKAVF